MRFAQPLYFLLLIPALLFFLLYLFEKIGKDASLKFSSLELLKSAKAKKSHRRFLPAFLRLISLCLVVLALARPQTGTGEEKKTVNAVDIMILLDDTGTMQAEDFRPVNRLHVAKEAAKDFIRGRKNDRIGLVAFASDAITICPLTTDYQALLALIDSVQYGMIQDGTAIGHGLAVGANRLKDSTAKSKVMVLISDGLNNTGNIDPITAMNIAKTLGIKVYTILIGTEGLIDLPVRDGVVPDGQRLVRYIKAEVGIDPVLMQRIAKETGGRYFKVGDTRALQEAFRMIDRLEKTEVTVDTYTHYEEKYFWFLWPALYIFMFEIILSRVLFPKLP